MISYYRKTIGFLHWFEDATLVAAFVAMLLLAIMQIILRNFFEAGVFWAESFLRMLILWVALLGAMIATRQRNHINVDAVSRYFHPRSQKIIDSFIALLSAVVCAVVGWYAYTFVLIEYEDQAIAFASVPSWVTELIIPLAFFVMAIRFAHQSLSNWVGPRS